jgi:hypothetical protein
MLREQAGLGATHTREEFLAACERYRAAHGEVSSMCRYEAPPGIYWDDQKYHGEAYGAYAWAIYVAQVAVDTVTYSAEVEDFWAVQEVGRVLHPVLAAGQIEGGIAQGIGYALYEKVVLENGRMTNNQMTNYIMPTAEDVPPIGVYFEEIPFPSWRVRREGSRRVAARRTRAGDSECHPRRDRREFYCHSTSARGSLCWTRSEPTGGGAGLVMNADGRARTDTHWPAIRFTVNGEIRTVSASRP